MGIVLGMPCVARFKHVRYLLATRLLLNAVAVKKTPFHVNYSLHALKGGYLGGVIRLIMQGV